jgi:hypothetical protein
MVLVLVPGGGCLGCVVGDHEQVGCGQGVGAVLATDVG